MRSKRGSVTGGVPYGSEGYGLYANSRPTPPGSLRYGGTNYSGVPNSINSNPLLAGSSGASAHGLGANVGGGGSGGPVSTGAVGSIPGSSSGNGNIGAKSTINNYSNKSSYYLSLLPLNCSDWVYHAGAETDCIALSSYKEDFTNKLEIINGASYGKEATYDYEDEQSAGENLAAGSPGSPGMDDGSLEGFDFHKICEIGTDYPITHLQWDPSMTRGLSNVERLATSLEVFRLYQIDHDLESPTDYKIKQTHILANNANNSSGESTSISNSSSSSSNSNATGKNDDANTFPPVTSFDWNKTDPSIIITLSVDTTCTIWDLNRSHQLSNSMDTASVKTQLIAHDSEVFDVKFIHDSVNIFASVGNDGSIRVFDLRSLEHSTIIYEPPSSTMPSVKTNKGINGNLANYPHHNSHALLKLSTSNVDQHHLATIGVNSNQVIIIDMRMPGVPAAKLDGSFDGINSTAINSIKWHPNSNFLLTGGDDCQALVWDCNSLPSSGGSATGVVEGMDMPILAYDSELEVNNVTWRADLGDWLGVVAGKGFQAVLL